MSAIASYGCQVLRGYNKVGNLKADEKGYREIVLGAFDCYNSGEEFYVLTAKVKAMFEHDGALMRRLSTAQMRGEIEHPMPQANDSLQTFMRRLKRIALDRVSHHIRNVRLEPGKDHEGRDIVLCIGEVRPAGAYRSTLEDAFQNQDENVSFSIRTLSRRWTEQCQVKKEVTGIITWDYVNEPGIAVATKYDTPSLECIHDLPFTEEELAAAEAAADALEEKVSVESGEVDFTFIRTAMGWDKVEVMNRKLSSDWI